MKAASFFWTVLIALVCAGCGGAGANFSGAARLKPVSRSVNLTVENAEYAILGRFAVSIPGGPAYAESGIFGVDSKGRLVHAATGAPLLGWGPDTLSNDSAPPPGVLSVPVGRHYPRRTTSLLRLRGNLDAEDWEWKIASPKVRVYDAFGGEHDLTFVFQFNRYEDGSDPTSPSNARSSWNWIAYEGDDAVGIVIGSSSAKGDSKLYFDGYGALALSPGTGSVQSLLVTLGAGHAGLAIKVDFAEIVSLKTFGQVTFLSQDGRPDTTLEGFDITRDGTIVGLFTHGYTKPLGRIAAYQFYDPQALAATTDGFERPTDLSGPALLWSWGYDSSIVARPVGE